MSHPPAPPPAALTRQYAWLSSTRYYAASNAIDGRYDTFALSAEGVSSWLSVMIPADRHVGNVAIYNVQLTQYQAQLGSFEVWLGAAPGDTTSALAFLCGWETYRSPPGIDVDPYIVWCGDASTFTTGRFVTVKQTGAQRYLLIAELIVFETALPPFPPLPPPPPPPQPPPAQPPSIPPSPPVPLVLGANWINMDGYWRKYHIAINSCYTPPCAMLIGLHGSNGNGDAFSASTGMGSTYPADAIVVYPDSIAGQWTAYDVVPGGFIVRLKQHLVPQLAVDPSRVFVFGFSSEYSTASLHRPERCWVQLLSTDSAPWISCPRWGCRSSFAGLLQPNRIRRSWLSWRSLRQ